MHVPRPARKGRVVGDFSIRKPVRVGEFEAVDDSTLLLLRRVDKEQPAEGELLGQDRPPHPRPRRRDTRCARTRASRSATAHPGKPAAHDDDVGTIGLGPLLASSSPWRNAVLTPPSAACVPSDSTARAGRPRHHASGPRMTVHRCLPDPLAIRGQIGGQPPAGHGALHQERPAGRAHPIACKHEILQLGRRARASGVAARSEAAEGPLLHPLGVDPRAPAHDGMHRRDVGGHSPAACPRLPTDRRQGENPVAVEFDDRSRVLRRPALRLALQSLVEGDPSRGARSHPPVKTASCVGQVTFEPCSRDREGICPAQTSDRLGKLGRHLRSAIRSRVPAVFVARTTHRRRRWWPASPTSTSPATTGRRPAAAWRAGDREAGRVEAPAVARTGDSAVASTTQPMGTSAPQDQDPAVPLNRLSVILGSFRRTRPQTSSCAGGPG